MKRKYLLLLFGLLATNTFNAKNSVIFADVPDLSMIRVNDIYYTSSDTIHMSPDVPSMNKIIGTLPNVIPNFYVIPSDGCEGFKDSLHFTTTGYRKLGKRYADEMLASLDVDKEAPLLKVNAPNGNIEVEVSVFKGKPFYTVRYNGKQFLKPSPLGLNTNIGNFMHDLILKDSLVIKTIKNTYSLPNIKKSKVNYEANEAVFTFLKDNSPVFDVIFRISNNDIAFRYELYSQNERESCIIKQEATGFVFPEETTTFLSAQSDAMVGFARTMPSYEITYEVDDEMGKNGQGNGYTFPCLFKVTDNGWVLLSETGVDSRYCASRLIGNENGLYTIGFPMPEENNGNGTSEPGITLPGSTPWRTITLGKTLAPIVETTVPFDVVEPRFKASKKYEYTRGTWSWIIGMDESTVYDEQIKYVDFSAALGYETVLVDALWDTQIGKDKIAQLSKYAKTKNVELYLWYNSNGYWNDAPQSPRGIMDNSITRRKEMAWMKSIGVKGIKVDFFGGDKQTTMKLYENILFDANDYGLMVIFHGCTLPRGWERMYPNYASSEAVLASENLHFSQQSCDAEAFNTSLHPFIRNTVGSMDFGGSTLNEYWNSKNSADMWGGHRITSDIFALATAVLFQSGVQHFALAPNNLNDAPNWAIDFMRNIPTTWDETKFIDGYPGKYIVLARRHKNTWYVVGVNAQKEQLNITVKLPMMSVGKKMTIYNDNKKLNGKVSTVKLEKNQKINLRAPKNGGVIITQKLKQ